MFPKTKLAAALCVQEGVKDTIADINQLYILYMFANFPITCLKHRTPFNGNWDQTPRDHVVQKYLVSGVVLECHPRWRTTRLFFWR